MGAEFLGRAGKIAARPAAAKLRVGNTAGVTVRKTKMQTRLGGAVQLVRGYIIAQVVASVIGEPQLLGVRVPIKSDRISDPPGKDLDLTAIGVHAQQRGVAFVRPGAHITRRADRHVELAVRSKADEFPAVPAVGRQPAVDHHRLGWVVEPRLNIVKAQDTVDFRHIQGSVTEGHAVWREQAVGQTHNFLGLVVGIAIDQRIHAALGAGADKNRSPLTECQGAGVRHLGRVQADRKSRPAAESD